MAQRLKAEDRREGIVRAARRLFVERGYEGVRVEEIAEAAGCSTGPVYHFFGTKADIYAAALRAGIRDAAASMARARSEDDDGQPALDRLIHSCHHLLGLISIKEVTAFTLEAPRVLGIDEYRDLFDKAMLPFIESDLRAAMIDGEIDPEPPEPLAVIIAGAIVTSANRVALSASTGDASEQLERYRGTLARLLERLRVHN